MPYQDDVTGWTITADDDGFHVPTDHPWETETFWTSFSVPERKMSGWFYNQVLANQGETGTCNGGAFIWTDAAENPYDVRVKAVPLPAERDLNDIALPNGNRIKTLEHLKCYMVQRFDKGRFEAELYFEGVMEPNPHPKGVWPFIRGNHFDQAMHVTGELVLFGEKIEIDCLSVRDRTWSPRPPRGWSRRPPDPNRPKRPYRTNAYVFGTQSPKDAFLAYTSVEEGRPGEPLDTGYLIRDGVWAHLVSGERHCLVDPDTGFVWHIELEAVDTLGRKLHATGEMLSHDKAPHSNNALFRWRWDGAEGWGENQGEQASWYPREKRG